MIQRKDLFDFMRMQVKNTADADGDRMPQAFARWSPAKPAGRSTTVRAQTR